MALTFYILYNADGSILGKLNYGYRKFSANKDKSPCAACDLTHGGLSLNETEGWKVVKKELEGMGCGVRQMHRDEVDESIKSFMKKEGLEYPVVLREEGAELKVVMSNDELGSCGGDARTFLRRLREKGVIGEKEGF